MATRLSGSGTRSNDFARRRDALVEALLTMHPATAAMLVRLGWFPKKNKALRRLRKLTQRNRIRLVGTVARGAGRPEHVYCKWRPKVDQLLHEVELTELCLRLHAAKILRGPHITNTKLRPDAEVWINDELYYLEWDRNTSACGRLVTKRFRQYQDCHHLVLWVCSSDARRDGLRRCADSIRGIALFTTAAEALHNPHAPIWVDAHGEKSALPRNGVGVEKQGK